MKPSPVKLFNTTSTPSPPVASMISCPNLVLLLSNTCFTPSDRKYACFRCARSGVHLRPRSMGQLYRRQSYPARPGMNQHPFPRLQLCQVIRQRCRHKDRGNSRQVRKCHPRRSMGHHLLPRNHLRPECSKSQRNHPVPHRHAAHIRPNLNHPPAHLTPQHPLLNQAPMPGTRPRNSAPPPPPQPALP